MNAKKLYQKLEIDFDLDKYYSELIDEERDFISHRGQNVREFLKHLKLN
ncbi:MAG: hypothetical protein Q7S18_03800 [bacterium]|nr:hypothetical protein [bacterium]